jgi:dihydrofolate reductase
VWIVGGGKTAALCLELGLIDELELYVVPRLLGAGVPIFLGSERTTDLEVIDVRQFKNQIVRLRYRARGVTVRAFSG